MSDLHVVILAAGKGPRMKSATPKVLHHLAGLSLIEHVLRTVDQLPVSTKVLVMGHGADDVREALSRKLVEAGFGLLQLKAEGKLESIFLQLTAKKGVPQ